MRKALVIGGVTLVTLIVTFFVWVQFPRETDPEFVQKAIASGQQYLAKGQSEALDPSKNGYLNETFLPYWGRKGKDGVENSAVQATVTGWNSFSSSAAGETIDHTKLITSKNAEYLANRTEFLKLVPELEKAMRSEVFVAPETKFDFETTLMNYIAVRACAQAMSGLAESEIASGRADVAAGHVGSIYSFSRSLQGKGALLNEMISIALGSIGHHAVVRLIEPKAKLSLQSRQSLARDILNSVPDENRLLGLLQGEFACSDLLFEQARANQAALSLGVPQLRVPGLLSREKRIYHNVNTRLLKEVESTGKVTLTTADTNPGTLDYFTGATGIYTQIIMPNLTRLQEQVDQDRAMRLAVGISYAAMAFRDEKGRLPKDLKELGAVYPIPTDVSTVGLTYAPSKDSATVHIPHAQAQEFVEGLKQPTGSPSWVQAKEDGLTFSL